MVRKGLLLAQRPRCGTEAASAPPLAEVANRALLVHAIEWLAEGGVSEVVIVAVPEIAAQARAALDADAPAGARVHWIECDPRRPVSEAIRTLGAFVDGEPFVVHPGDCLFRDGVRAVLGDRRIDRLDAVVAVRPLADCGPQVVELAGRGHERGVAATGTPTGVAVLGGAVVPEALAGADPPVCDIRLLARRLRDLGGRVTVREVGDWWALRGDGEGLLAGNRFALADISTDLSGATVRDTRIEGAVAAARGAVLESSIVRGPVVIGAGARVLDAYIGPYTSIGAGACVEGAEIEHSILLEGVSISHIGTRLEASVLGRRARVFRDFRLPSGMRVRVGEGAQIAFT